MGQCRLKSLSRRARQCPSSVTSTPSIWSTRGSTPAGRAGVVQSLFSAWPHRQQCEAELWRQYQGTAKPQHRTSLPPRQRGPAPAEGRREMSLLQLASVCLIGLVLIGCAKTMSDEEKANAARVRITNNPEFTRGCAFVGMVSDDDMQDLQRKAFRLGGNIALVRFQSQRASPYSLQTYTTAEVYRGESTR